MSGDQRCSCPLEEGMELPIAAPNDSIGSALPVCVGWAPNLQTACRSVVRVLHADGVGIAHHAFGKRHSLGVDCGLVDRLYRLGDRPADIAFGQIAPNEIELAVPARGAEIGARAGAGSNRWAFTSANRCHTCGSPQKFWPKTTAHSAGQRTCYTRDWTFIEYSIGKCAVVSGCAVVLQEGFSVRYTNVCPANRFFRRCVGVANRGFLGRPQFGADRPYRCVAFR
jgi:hypothetical protein